MSANLRAFLALIRWAEGTAGDNGYRTMVGGRLFDGFADHPRRIQTIRFGSQEIHSSAAGAYQFLTSTWDRCAKALDLPDFSPESQDKAAIWLISERKALADVEAGRLREALDKCSWEWASLPPSRYGQPNKSYDACAVVFERAGGTILQGSPATQPSAAPPPPAAKVPAPIPVKETIMAIPALVAAAASALLPIVADLFRARGSKTGNRNAEIVDQLGDAAPTLIAIAKEVAGGGNEQQVTEAILASKDLQQQFRAAVALKWSDLEPFLRFDEESRSKAREFTDVMTSEGPQWRQIGWGALIGILAMAIIGGVGYTFWHVLFSDGTTFSQSTRDGIVELMKNVAILVIGFFFGSSASNRQKDVTIAEQAKR